MRELMMKMKRALVGLMLGGLSTMMIRDWPASTPSIDDHIERAIRQVKRTSQYRKAFNGCRPAVKQARRQAVRQRSRRRARRLGHA